MANEKRLIDANMLKANFPILGISASNLWSSGGVRRAIDNAPTVDAVEVVHGRWIRREIDLEHYEGYDIDDCSVCGRNGLPWYAYCPNCGAKMDLEDLNDD